MSDATIPDLETLFRQLEQALAERDSARADALIRQIEARLLGETGELQAAAERLRQITTRRPASGGDAPAPAPVLMLGAAAGLAGVALGAPERDSGTESREGIEFPVFFASNRNWTGTAFTAERSREITRGRALVHIPETHRFGETGSSFWRRLIGDDDRLTLTATEILAPTAFHQNLRARAAAARDHGEAPDALIFLHGYNTSFEDAAIRAAQIGCDLRVAGPVGLFAWASRGSVSGYLADEATIEASESAIANFLVEFAENCGTDRLHVIAHSMGNRGLLRALQRIFADARGRGQVKFNQIILAAPDVDRDLFLDLAYLYPNFAERTTLYASKADRAVTLSAKLHFAPRIGYFEPLTLTPGVDTIAVPDFDLDHLGHGYFAQAEAVLHDMFDLFKSGTPPDRRQRIKPLVRPDGQGWCLQR